MAIDWDALGCLKLKVTETQVQLAQTIKIRKVPSKPEQ